jgi:hypothetical protein
LFARQHIEYAGRVALRNKRNKAPLICDVHTLLKIFLGRGSNTIFCPREEIGPFAEDHRSRWARYGAGRFQVLLEALIITELTLHDFGVPVVALKLWYHAGGSQAMHALFFDEGGESGLMNVH